jgi:hypothetical protein
MPSQEKGVISYAQLRIGPRGTDTDTVDTDLRMVRVWEGGGHFAH